MTADEVIARIKEISKGQILRSHSHFDITRKCYMNVDEHFEISKMIYHYIDGVQMPKFLSLRDLLLVDGQMDCFDEDVNLVIEKVSNRIDELLEK